MSVNFLSIQNTLNKEIETLGNLIYRSKNQHKSSLVLRKMIHLKRLLRIEKLTQTDKIKITNCAKNLYIAASSNLSMGFFIPFSLCTLGISARIFYLINNCEIEKKTTVIDDLFAKVIKN